MQQPWWKQSTNSARRTIGRVDQKSMKISLLGLGLMGLPIALRLQQQGFEVFGWNRGAGRADEAQRQGLTVTREAGHAVAAADLILLALSDLDAIRSVLLRPEVKRELAGKMVVQMGTIAPAESRSLAAAVQQAGGDYLEAPVLGSIPEARAGTLIIMAGGTPENYTKARPLLEALGKSPRHVGNIGQGAALKLAMNQLIASLTSGFSLSLGLVQAEGLDVDLFMSLLRSSALYAPTFDKKLGKMLRHDYTRPNFPLRHMIKDVELFRQVATADGIDPTLTLAISAILERSRQAGHGDDDYSALYEGITADS